MPIKHHPDRCLGDTCAKCEPSCPYGALKYEKGKRVIIDGKKCDGVCADEHGKGSFNRPCITACHAAKTTAGQQKHNTALTEH